MANRRRQSASDIARALNCDPFKYLADQFNRAKDGTERKDHLALELLPYCYPKLKAVDVDVSGNLDFTVTIGGPDLTQLGNTAKSESGDDGG